jgi:microsomal dipeptidase-like Zn-dependent dipeptidase
MPEIFPDAQNKEYATSMIGPDRVADIAGELLTRGADEASVGTILGGNWLRVAGEVGG